MNKITETELRQLLDLLENKSKSDEFDSTFFKGVKAAVQWKDAKNVLDSMKKSYDYFVINAMKSYGLNTDKIYVDLDVSWDIANRLHDTNDLETAIMTYLSLRTKTGKVWNDYKQRVIKIVNKRGQEALRNE